MAATESVVVPAKKQKPKPTHPTYFEMAKDAISSLADKKGSSVPAIQSYIAGKYNLDTDTVRTHLKPALAKGLENGTFVRPKNSDAKGYTGRFKVDKTKASEEDKAKKQKEKAKLASEKATEKAKTAVAKKTASKKTPTKKKADDKAKKKVTEKTVVKKSPKKIITEKKPKAAKATLKTPKKAPKTLKAAKKAKTPSTSTKSKK